MSFFTLLHNLYSGKVFFIGNAIILIILIYSYSMYTMCILINNSKKCQQMSGGKYFQKVPCYSHRVFIILGLCAIPCVIKKKNAHDKLPVKHHQIHYKHFNCVTQYTRKVYQILDTVEYFTVICKLIFIYVHSHNFMCTLSRTFKVKNISDKKFVLIYTSFYV